MSDYNIPIFTSYALLLKGKIRGAVIKYRRYENDYIFVQKKPLFGAPIIVCVKSLRGIVMKNLTIHYIMCHYTTLSYT